MTNCIFCDIIAKTAPAEIFYEDEDLIVINNIQPLAPIHWLIIPRRHIVSLNELTKEDEALAGRLLLAVSKMAVKAGIDPIYFGFMFIYVGCIGLITPPVGTVQNVVAGVGRLRMETVIKGTNPFLMVYVLLAVLFVIFPQIILAPLRWMH